MSLLAKEAGKQGKRFAGKILDEFLTSVAAREQRRLTTI